MKQADLGLSLTTKRTRKREFLAAMERVVPWAALVALVAPYAPAAKTGRPPFAVEKMLRIHFMQQWFTLNDPAMEEALHDVPLFREFVGLGWDTRLPDESTILRFRHLLEKHELAEQILATVNELLCARGLMLKAGTVVDATLIAAPSSTKNQSGQRDPDMHQGKKGSQWHFGMKAHIRVDAESGLVHTVKGTAVNVNDVVQANVLLHGEEINAFGDAGYQGAAKRPDAKDDVEWHIAMRPGKRRALDKTNPVDVVIDEIERLKASIRAKVEHPFRVVKRQFGHVKVRYRGLRKNTVQLVTLFALSNLWMVRRVLQVLDGQVPCESGECGLKNRGIQRPGAPNGTAGSYRTQQFGRITAFPLRFVLDASFSDCPKASQLPIGHVHQTLHREFQNVNIKTAASYTETQPNGY